ncbi:MAG: hypothetical protein M3326_12290 [Actinomycetota bacterium]|nr:hypothetical protein [Actinomycetota bacterium]
MFKDLDDHVGDLDVLINNAGIGGATAPAEDLSLEDWRAVVAGDRPVDQAIRRTGRSVVHPRQLAPIVVTATTGPAVRPSELAVRGPGGAIRSPRVQRGGVSGGMQGPA